MQITPSGHAPRFLLVLVNILMAFVPTNQSDPTIMTGGAVSTDVKLDNSNSDSSFT